MECLALAEGRQVLSAPNEASRVFPQCKDLDRRNPRGESERSFGNGAHLEAQNTPNTLRQ